MIYLRPLVSKLVKDRELAREISRKGSDEEMLEGLLSANVSIEDLSARFLKHYGVQYKSLTIEEIDEDLTGQFDLKSLRSESVIPYGFDSATNKWSFSIGDLTNKSIQQNITNSVKNRGQSVEFAFTFSSVIDSIYEAISNQKSGLKFEVTDDVSNDAVDWVETIINDGIKFKASDIHIERVADGLKVRYRIDGSMGVNRTFDMSSNEISNIHVRLKLIGNMDITEKRRSQDGRIDNYEYKDQLYSMRLSTINTIHGEKFVMRVFSEDEDITNFESLGFTSEQENKISEAIRKSNGIIYLAGATGSGKTTTLYAMIDKLNSESLNIYTLENPVEKSIVGVNQIQIDEASGNTYPSSLKALLRQDPDILVIGEIREKETAELAVQSSLTGHLVMTTIHANSALDSISRLVDMGVENYLIGASSVAFISQRLVRKLCPHCKRRVDHIEDYERLWIEKEIKDFKYEEHMANGEFLYENVGCSKCIKGYKGRLAVLEIVEVDNDIKRLISKGIAIEEIRDALIENGYTNMKHDGISKALTGVTSIQELMSKLQN